MPGSPSVCYLRDIQTLFETGTAGALSDRQLLERFVGVRGAAAETAFEVLVLRHGPMVLRVCQNVLQDPTDAEDAFQATFLVLVRRCRSIRRLESVGSWLYGVAHRVASRARLDAARRRAAERRGGLRIMANSDSGAVGDAEHGEFGPLIGQEVQRLPEKYRAVVVLCYWQGLNQEQAAARLDCPLGTVRSRLARARNLLHRRLTRRGLAPLAGLLAAALDRASTTASASTEISRLTPVSLELVQSTIRAASQVAAGHATTQVVPAVVASLVQRMLWSMAMIKIKGVVLGLVLAGFLCYGAGLATGQAKGARPAQTPGTSAAAKPAPTGEIVQDQPKSLDQSKPADGIGKRSTPAKVYSNVSSTIISIRPNHSNVMKGELVCELDSAHLYDRLITQKLAVSNAKASCLNATLTREVAEIAVVEYAEGIFRTQDEETAGDIKIAEAELALAEEELRNTKKYVNRPGGGSSLDIKRTELTVLRAGVSLEKARARQKLLRDFTRPKTIKKLKSDVEKLRSNELAKQTILALEAEREKKLERMIGLCRILAPKDGTLVYAPGAGIEEGSVVGERQFLFTVIPDPGPNSKKPE